MGRFALPTLGVDLGSALAPFGMLARDPTVRSSPGRFERATHTPEGPGLIRVTWEGSRPEALVHTDGDGATWLERQAPAMLGLLDDVTGFAPTAEPLRTLWRRHRGDRVTASGTLWHDLAWFVVQQRVTRAEAATQWGRLVRALGSPAPGSADLLVPPGPSTLARLAYHQLHRFGVERQRAENLLAAARAAHRIHAAPAADPATTLTALRAVRGVGPWTAGCLSTFTWGDADAVITGDAGIPSMITWLLAGEPRGDDERMQQLLAPYRPHRYRVVRLAFAGGTRPPRRAPRAPVHHFRDR